jgi:hypothetical protein
MQHLLRARHLLLRVGIALKQQHLLAAVAV